MKKKENYNDKKLSELEKLLREEMKAHFDLKIENGQRKLKNGHKINFKRKEIAQIKTAIRTKELTDAG